jgi:hypothetical protein
MHGERLEATGVASSGRRVTRGASGLATVLRAVRVGVRFAFSSHTCGLVPWRALVWGEQAFLPLLYGCLHRLRLARVVAARWCPYHGNVLVGGGS